MPSPVKLRDLLAALREADPEIRVLEQRGKGSHLMLCKEYPEGKRSFPIPTSSGEVAGPYQKKIIELYGLPKDVFLRQKASRPREAEAQENKDAPSQQPGRAAEEPQGEHPHKRASPPKE